MKRLYRKIIRAAARQYCQTYAREQRAQAEAIPESRIAHVMYMQNAVAAETIVRAIAIEEVNERG